MILAELTPLTRVVRRTVEPANEIHRYLKGAALITERKEVYRAKQA